MHIFFKSSQVPSTDIIFKYQVKYQVGMILLKSSQVPSTYVIFKYQVKYQVEVIPVMYQD